VPIGGKRRVKQTPRYFDVATELTADDENDDDDEDDPRALSGHGTAVPD
jgi:hypothetical protein